MCWGRRGVVAEADGRGLVMGLFLGKRLRSPAVVGAVRLSGLSQHAEKPVKAENDRKGDCLRSLPKVDEGGTFR